MNAPLVSRGVVVALVSARLVAGVSWPALAAPPGSVPPPVSGRASDDPSAIQPADVLARVELLEAHLEDVRLYMGRPKRLPPLLRVEGAQQLEVLAQSRVLQRRVEQLAFEQLRIPFSEVEAVSLPRIEDVIATVDRSIARVLQIKQAFGIERSVAEVSKPESTGPDEVFEAIVRAGALTHSLHERPTDATLVYSALMGGLQLARKIHAERTQRFLPPPAPFEPNKTPAEVYDVLVRCVEHLRAVAQAHGARMLHLVPAAPDRTVEPDDVLTLAAVVIAELVFVHVLLLERPAQPRFIDFQRKFPSHAHQKARDVEAILASLAQAESGR